MNNEPSLVLIWVKSNSEATLLLVSFFFFFFVSSNSYSLLEQGIPNYLCDK
jgi:hypothetical protein